MVSLACASQCEVAYSRMYGEQQLGQLLDKLTLVESRIEAGPGHGDSGARGEREWVYLFNVVIRNQARRLILVIGAGFLLGLPPAVIVILLEDVQQVALLDG